MATKVRETFYNTRTTSADGKVDEQEYLSEAQLKKVQSEAEKYGAVFEITKGQSFLLTTADSINEILELVKNDKMALFHFNYGVKLAQQNARRDFMKSGDEPIEGDIDLIADANVQEERQPRVSDPSAALKRALRAMAAKAGQPEPTEAEINAVLSVFLKTAQPVA